jgi:hypothetical protein
MKLFFFMCLSVSVFGQRSVFTECEYSSGETIFGMGFVKLDAEKIIIQFKKNDDDRITIDYRFEVETVRTDAGVYYIDLKNGGRVEIKFGEWLKYDAPAMNDGIMILKF